MSQNQLRQHLKRTWSVRFRVFLQKNRLGGIGRNVFLDSGVHLMRYPKNIFLANGVVVKNGARICACNEKASVRIGENTTFGYHSFIFASEDVTIGDNCLIAPFVYIVDSDHNIEKGQLINQQGNSTAPIIIGNDVWIGTGAKILKGVEIGDGAIIAAGALVKENVDSYTIVGGIPSKKISDRI